MTFGAAAKVAVGAAGGGGGEGGVAFAACLLHPARKMATAAVAMQVKRLNLPLIMKPSIRLFESTSLADRENSQFSSAESEFVGFVEEKGSAAKHGGQFAKARLGALSFGGQCLQSGGQKLPQARKRHGQGNQQKHPRSHRTQCSDWSVHARIRTAKRGKKEDSKSAENYQNGQFGCEVAADHLGRNQV